MAPIASSKERRSIAEGESGVAAVAPAMVSGSVAANSEVGHAVSKCAQHFAVTPNMSYVSEKKHN